jgi:hypothetical protein
MKRYMHLYTVEGTGGFPIEMLRRDGATPADEQDAHRIRDSYVKRPIRQRITLRAIDIRPWTPISAQWQSFGWQVVATETPRALSA